jgi:alpha-tubulin suppressor-like RCC1 family protein
MSDSISTALAGQAGRRDELYEDIHTVRETWMIKRVLLAIAMVTACGGDSTSPDGSLSPTGAGMHALVAMDSIGIVDSATAKIPAVVVLDASNRGTAGVRVTFHVVAGAGKLTDSVVTTDGNGRASLGAWTLGPAPTDNIIEANADGHAAVRFTVAAQWPRRLASNALGACAVKDDNVYCWGDNSHLELGANFAPASTLSPIVSLLSIIRTPVEISGAYGNHMCAVVSTRAGFCWGRNDYGQAGSTNRNAGGVTPAQLTRAWRSLSVGRITTCGVDTIGSGLCWGANQHGEIGNPGVLTSPTAGNSGPTLVLAPAQFRSIAAGWLHACGIATTNVAYCWGGNTHGELGLGIVDSTHPNATAVVSSEKFASIAAGGMHTCALTTDGRAFCWGQNAYGQLGDGTHTLHSTPTAVVGGLHFASIFVGTFFITEPPPESQATLSAGVPAHTCAITTDGKPYCWGWNGWGQLGDGTLEDRLVPTPVSGALTMNGLTLTESSTCGMRGTRVWCWGANSAGQLGDGTTTRRLQPVQVPIP